MNGSSDNTIKVLQDGSSNIAGVHIVGNHNDINVNQTGTDLLLGSDTNNWNLNNSIVISGNSNMVDVHQSGFGHSSTVNISGNNNVSTTT